MVHCTGAYQTAANDTLSERKNHSVTRALTFAALVMYQLPAVAANAQGAVTTRTQSKDAWRDSSADSLVARAIARRQLQLADSTLLSYHANAHGFLAFLVQIGEGRIIPPKVVQTEELASTITWWQPGRSAQQLVGRRDTTLLPAEVGYYRDRYAVVLDNLPDRIRLGDGYDVKDVPHPLGADAATRYEYRRGGGIDIKIPGSLIKVDEVEFRPRDQSVPSAIGSVYLDRESGAVVRLSMTFTRAAILDKRIETLVLTLENSLINGRYWLPRRQEVEVSRSSTWLEIPMRGVVRGHWQISGYDVNEKVPTATLALPRWSSVSRDSLRGHRFEGKVTDVLPPEMRLAEDEDVAVARKMAEAAVRAATLARSSKSTAYTRGISDVFRVTRTEGIAVGAGLSQRWGDAWLASLRARYGISDRQVKGRVSLGRTPAMGGAPRAEVFVEREYRDIAEPERSGFANTVAAGFFASDFTTQVDTRAAGISFRAPASTSGVIRIAAESDRPLFVRATPLSGTYGGTVPAWKLDGARVELREVTTKVSLDNPRNRTTFAVAAAFGAYRGKDNFGNRVSPLVGRAGISMDVERALSGERLLSAQTRVSEAVGRDLPPQWLVFAGGPSSAPGYVWSSLAGKSVASQRFELRQQVRSPSISLGKYGRSPAHVTLAPYVQATLLDKPANLSANKSGVYPSAGLGLYFFFDILRFDAARDLRHGKWYFGLDVDRAFWSLF